MYRFKLQSYKGVKTRFPCPKCEKPRQFTRYIDTKTGLHLPDKYGICNRINKCGYHLNPYKDGYHKGKEGFQDWQSNPEPIRPQIYIPNDIFKASLSNYKDNKFAAILIQLFGEEKAIELIQQYYIGTSKYWEGATIFWIIDQEGRIAGGQVVLFDENGSTKVNGSYRYTNWVHTALKSSYKIQDKPIPQWLTDYSEHSNKFPVPFGLPQIYNSKPIAMVEAPKTAVIASGFFPKYNWVAIGGATFLNNIHRIKPLEGKRITLFPDAGYFDLWQEQAIKHSHLAKFTVSNLLEEKKAQKGNDIADYLIKMNYSDFEHESKSEVNKQHPRQFPSLGTTEDNVLINKHGYPSSWDE